MRIVLLAAILGLAAPASAQQARQQDNDDILVVGNRQMRETVRDFVDALSGPRGGADPIARLDGSAVCVGVVGLSESRNSAIAARMRQVAAAAGMSTAPPDCRPTVLVILARDKEEMIRALRRRHNTLFQDGTGTERIPRQPGPVAAWHVERLIDRSGMTVVYDNELGYYVLHAPVVPSRISAPVRPVFVGAVVVIETAALVGLSTTQVADYAAMRAFTQADPAQLRDLEVPTILSAIEAPEGSPVPLSLTQWDLTYLRALAATPAYNYGPRQRTAMRRHMIDELEAEDGGQ